MILYCDLRWQRSSSYVYTYNHEVYGSLFCWNVRGARCYVVRIFAMYTIIVRTGSTMVRRTTSIVLRSTYFCHVYYYSTGSTMVIRATSIVRYTHASFARE
jgi:hypothetical protein